MNARRLLARGGPCTLFAALAVGGAAAAQSDPGGRSAAYQAFARGDFAVARQRFEALARTGDWYAELMLGAIAESEGDWRSALSCYRRAAEMAPERPEPARERARLEQRLREVRRFADARRRLDRDLTFVIAGLAGLALLFCVRGRRR